jgi:hypothetical protein
MIEPVTTGIFWQKSTVWRIIWYPCSSVMAAVLNM